MLKLDGQFAQLLVTIICNDCPYDGKILPINYNGSEYDIVITRNSLRIIDANNVVVANIEKYFSKRKLGRPSIDDIRNN